HLNCCDPDVIHDYSPPSSNAGRPLVRAQFHRPAILQGTAATATVWVGRLTVRWSPLTRERLPQTFADSRPSHLYCTAYNSLPSGHSCLSTHRLLGGGVGPGIRRESARIHLGKGTRHATGTGGIWASARTP